MKPFGVMTMEITNEEWVERNTPFHPERGDGIEEAIKCTRNCRRSILSDQYMINYADSLLFLIADELGFPYEKYDFRSLYKILKRVRRMKKRLEKLNTPVE